MDYRRASIADDLQTTSRVCELLSAILATLTQTVDQWFSKVARNAEWKHRLPIHPGEGMESLTNNEYAVQDMRTRVPGMLRDETKDAGHEEIGRVDLTLSAILGSNPAPSDSIAPVCPSCSAVMVKRQAQKEHNAGRYFWACSTFPRCRRLEEVRDGM